MRPIHLVHLDKPRPALLLTRPAAIGAMSRVTVAPITSTVRGISTEVPVDETNGLDHASVVSCDNLQTLRLSHVGRRLGALHDSQEAALATALANAFDLHLEDLP